MHIIPVKVLKWDSKNAIIKKQQIDLRKEIWYYKNNLIYDKK